MEIWSAKRVAAARIQRLTVTPLQRRGEGSFAHLNDLVRRVASERDRAAFADLFSLMAPRVKTYLMRKGATPEVAEDVAQETMLTVWRKASYFDPSRANAMTWIFTIARNLRIDGQRRKVESDAISPDMTEMASGLPTPEEQVLTASREERVRKALGALSREQEAIVKLSFFREHPHGEIARELGLPLGTVKSRLRLALARLRKLLDEEI